MERRAISSFASYLNIEKSFPDVEICGVEKDNRSIKTGDLFVAIRGEKFDGHNFAASAVENGAVAVLCERELEVGVPCLVVEDSIRGLQAIARGYRAEFSPKVVGVTGSVGKTTTKEMIASVLSEKYNTLKTEGNLNNEIGLPFTVLNLNKNHEAAVIEMGMNHFGEISRLTRIASPDIAVISAIGESHIEFLGSKEGILKAKLEILEGLSDDGTVILNGDDEYLISLKGKLPFKTIYYGITNNESDIFATAKSVSLNEIIFTVRGTENFEFKINCGGEHNLKNALAAVAVGRELGLSNEEIARGLDKFENTGMRQKIIKKDGRTIINDCYNANPDSMRASLKLLSDIEGRKIAVIADMLELGESSKDAHTELGRLAADMADIIFVTGNMRECVKAGAGDAEIYVFEDVASLCAKLKEIWTEGDTVLVKASRGMRLERVVESLCE